MRASAGILMASAAGGGAPLTFADPLVSAEPGNTNGTPSSQDSNSATLTSRGLVLAAMQRGSNINRTVSSVVGGGSLPTPFGHIVTATGNSVNDQTYTNAYAYDVSGSGTGAATITWSGSVWTCFAALLELENYSIIESIAGDANEAETSISMTLANTVLAEDLIISHCIQRDDATFGVPSGMSALQYDGTPDVDIDMTPSTTARWRAAWRRGGGQSVDWTGLVSTDCAAAVALHLRRVA